MMIIRATNKLLKTSGIKPIKNSDELLPDLPGEWYAGLISMGRPGKLTIHFLHHPTMISVLIPGKSLKKALKLFPDRVKNLLKRNGYSKLLFQFQLRTGFEVYSTNSRSMLSHMTQLSYNIEYHFALAETTEDIDWDYIEDVHFDHLHSKNKKHFRSKDILDGLC